MKNMDVYKPDVDEFFLRYLNVNADPNNAAPGQFSHVR